MTLATEKSPLLLNHGQYQLEAIESQTAFLTSYRGVALPSRRPVWLQTWPDRFTSQQGEVGAVAQSALLRQAFLDAAQDVAQVAAPHLPEVLATFAAGDRPYIVLAVPNGISLAERLQTDGPLPELEALQIVRQVGETLISLHAAGLLHWDVQPQHLIWDAQSQQVVLTHLSWARLALLGDAAPDPHWFAPGYTALEQYLPGAAATPATDLYALAGTLYTLVTGQVPIAAIQRDRQPLVNPRQFRPDLSPIVEQVILQGMEINPRLRPQSLDQWLALFPKRSRAATGTSRSLVLPPLGSPPAPRPSDLPLLQTVKPIAGPVVSPGAQPSAIAAPLSATLSSTSPAAPPPETPPAQPTDMGVARTRRRRGVALTQPPTPAVAANVLSLPKLGQPSRRLSPPSPQDPLPVPPAAAIQTSSQVSTQMTADLADRVDDRVDSGPVQSTSVKTTVKSKKVTPRFQRAASPSSRSSGTPVYPNSSPPSSPPSTKPARFPSNRRLFQGLLLASAAAAFFGGGFGLTLRFASDRGPMNSRLLQPNQSFPPQAWPGEADAAQFDFSNLPARGESPRWEDPVTPAQPTWPLEEESAFPPPPVTRAPIAPEPAQEPPGTQEPASEVSPLPAPAAETPLPNFPSAPAASTQPESSPLPSASTVPLPEPASPGIDTSPVEPALPAAPPPPVDAAGEASPIPTMPMQESRLTPPEELS